MGMAPAHPSGGWPRTYPYNYEGWRAARHRGVPSPVGEGDHPVALQDVLHDEDRLHQLCCWDNVVKAAGEDERHQVLHPIRRHHGQRNVAPVEKILDEPI